MIERIKYHFDASHRLSNYSGKCRNLHGHRWEVEIFIKGNVDEKTDMVVDFTKIKGIIDEFDHKTILCKNDENEKFIPIFDDLRLDYILLENEPTAENLTFEIYTRIHRLVPLCLIRIKLWESPGCCVEYGDKIES